MAPNSSNLDSVARIAHKVALGIIAACALAIFLGEEAESPLFDRTYTVWGVGTALGAVICRRFSSSPVIQRQTGIALSLGGFAFAIALACVGLLLARDTGARSAGLVFSLVAGIFCIRPILRPESANSRS